MTIETKFNIDDEVFWAGYDGNWHCGEIIGIFIIENKIKYILLEFEKFYTYIDEIELFSTKEELLKSL